MKKLVVKVKTPKSTKDVVKYVNPLFTAKLDKNTGLITAKANAVVPYVKMREEFLNKDNVFTLTPSGSDKESFNYYSDGVFHQNG